jgi:Zn-dependent M16 (insulinase) family peptidase
MKQKRAALTSDQIAAIAASAAALQASQGVANSPEALARLPQLAISDLPRQPRAIPTSTGQLDGLTVLRHDVFSNGVVYLELDVDLAGLPAELVRWLPHFSDAMNKLGAGGQSFEKIAQRRAACTGGLWCGILACRHAVQTDRTLRRVRIGLKTLDGQVDRALQLVDDLVFGLDPRDRNRLRDVLVQARAHFRSNLVNQGRSTALRHAARGLSVEGALNHLWFGIPGLRDAEDLAGRLDERAEEVMANIERIRDFLRNRRRWTVSYTGSEIGFRSLERTLRGWRSRMRDEEIVDAVEPFEPYAQPPREGLAGPMQVAHCARVMPAPSLSDPDAPGFAVGSRLASYDYFLPEIRFKGNAYGGGALYDAASGTLGMFSFRDPRIVETLGIFDGLRDWLAAQAWSEADIQRAVIGCAKEEEKPIRPAEATRMGLMRHVCGVTNELRARQYQALLSATPLVVKATMERVLETGWDRSAICVVSSREKLSDANKVLGSKALEVADILDGPLTSLLKKKQGAD